MLPKRDPLNMDPESYSIVKDRFARGGTPRDTGLSRAGRPRRARSTKRGSEREGLGGADRDRTDDPGLAKPVLSQLSYSPKLAGGSRSGGPG